jgi:hypothetical protein
MRRLVQSRLNAYTGGSMRSYKKITAFAVCAAITAAMLIMAGCSGQQGGGTPYSETLNGEEARIWYECQNKIDKPEEEQYIIEGVEDEEEVVEGYGRETRVVWIKVFKDGKLSTYSCAQNVYLGYFAKMTDEEIIKELESDEDKYIKGQENEDYKIYLYTDPSGHEVVYEGIPVKIKQGYKEDPMYFMTLFSKEQVEPFQVYDSYFAGYELYNYDETKFGQACAVTRCESGDRFGLDDLELENAELDYETPEDLLHEMNKALRKELKKAKK